VAGTLFVVATPLGHLQDLSPRALETLRAVSLIACEDTRRTSKILARFAAPTRMISCHRFNEKERIEPVIRALEAGEDVALVSDGGTPGVSDPGRHLVQAARERGIRVVPVPGPSALVALLSVSGLDADRFVFDGFLPPRAGERRRRLRDLVEETRTVVIYEAPHRIRPALEDIAATFGERTIVIGRELTKVHEEIRAGSAREILASLEDDSPSRGEFTIAIAGAGCEAVASHPESTIIDAWRTALRDAEGDTRSALRACSKQLAMRRPDLYRRLQELGEIG
jgi:16S rRNA (cytidine1402-2'-O)-methyltransferase